MAPTLPVFTFDTGFVEPNLRTGSPADWTQFTVSTDVNAPSAALTLEHGRAVMRVSGGSGVQSNRRDFWQLPGVTPFPYWRLRSRWASPPPADGIMEHGYAMNLHLGADGRYRSVVLWHFIPGLLIAGVWDWLPTSSGLVVTQTGPRDHEVVSAFSRASNVVTVTVPADATSRWRVGDPITADAATASFDGTFILSSVASTQLQWAQIGANEAGGAGSVVLAGQSNGGFAITRNFLASDLARVNGVVTSTGLPLDNPFRIGDWVTVDAADNTYDSRFILSNVNPFSGQVSWNQAGVDDVSGGGTQIGKTTPYYVEARLLPGGILQARATPDYGVSTNLGGTAIGCVNADAPWEGPDCITFDLNKIGIGAATAAIPGVPAIMAAHGSFNSWAVYDNIAAEKLSF